MRLLFTVAVVLAITWLLSGGSGKSGFYAERAGNKLLAQQAAPTEELQQAPPASAVPRHATEAKPSGLKAVLRRRIDESHFNRLLDGREIDEEETETLLKVMLELTAFNLQEREQWARRDWEAARLFKNSREEQGDIFVVSGRVRRVEELVPTPEFAKLFQLPRYYRCELRLAAGEGAKKEAGNEAVVFARFVPRSWQQGETLDENAGALGIYLKCVGESAQQPCPVFVAERMAWYPDTPLGRLGMDVGLLDGVSNGRRVLDSEREAFYQMLAAVGRAKPGELLRLAERQLAELPEKMREQWIDKEGVPHHLPYKWTDAQGIERYSVQPLFNLPHARHGQLVALRGTVRQIRHVIVDDRDIRARFGITHYYEVPLFTEDSGDNPLVICVRELPQGLPVGESAEARANVEVAGFFFKLWSYRIEIPRGFEDERGGPGPVYQLAPLIFARDLHWYPVEKPGVNIWAGIIGGICVAVAVVVFWIAGWWSARRSPRIRPPGAEQIKIDMPD
jgi:hypothetical protein